MKKGTVKFFNAQKGFGFIQPTDQDKDIFVHQTGLIDTIKENDEVEYEEDGFRVIIVGTYRDMQDKEHNTNILKWMKRIKER